MIKFTTKECRYLLDLIGEKEGFGYSEDEMIGPLQAKLSMLLELAQKMGR